MDTYLFHPVEFERLYNCSTYSVEDVPLEQRQHIALGSVFLILFTLFELLYIPCLVAISRHLHNACYKFMFYLGVIDVACMFVCGLLTGYLAVTGAVYCSHPQLIYFGGVVGNLLWVIESTTSICLALNRCVEMSSNHYGRMLYDGKRTWLWMVPPTVYGLLFVWFTKPVCFSGIYMAWFFNPHVGYVDDAGTAYYNLIHSAHNNVILFGLSGLYLTFAVLLVSKTASLTSLTSAAPTSLASNERIRGQKMSFLQVALISAANVTGAGIYVYMQYFTTGQLLIYVASYMWLIIHGMPSVIYIAVNRTIRNECLRMVRSAVPQWKCLQKMRCGDVGAGSSYRLGLNSVYPTVTLSVPEHPPSY